MVSSSDLQDTTVSPQFDEVWERVKRATALRTQADLAAALNLKSPSVSGAKQRGLFPLDWAFRLALTYGLSLDYLLRGQNPAYDPSRTVVEEFTCASPCNTPLARIKVVDAHPDAVVAAQTVETVEADGCTLVMVPMVEARLSAGTGSFETGDSAERRYAFRSDWISSKGQAARMALMRVAGDSMEPHIFNNDMVLVDQSQTKPRAGSLFAVAVEDVVYIKMVDTLPGKIVLKSYNEAYTPLEIDARGDLADGIRIIGRAVWIGRELY